jgi:hypothetical protein
LYIPDLAGTTAITIGVTDGNCGGTEAATRRVFSSGGFFALAGLYNRQKSAKLPA